MTRNGWCLWETALWALCLPVPIRNVLGDFTFVARLTYRGSYAFFSWRKSCVVCRNPKINTTIPPGYRRVLKKGRRNHAHVFQFFKKENGGLKYGFQTADISNRKIVVEQRFCVWGVYLCGPKETEPTTAIHRLRIIGSASLRLALLQLMFSIQLQKREFCAKPLSF